MIGEKSSDGEKGICVFNKLIEIFMYSLIYYSQHQLLYKS